MWSLFHVKFVWGSFDLQPNTNEKTGYPATQAELSPSEALTSYQVLL